MKLDKKDLILLSELKKNSRAPLTYLAKAARLSKESAHYRLKRLGKFVKFIALVNYAKVGYQYFLLSLKIDKAHPKYEEIIQSLSKSNDILWLSETSVYSETSYNIRALVIKRRKKDAEILRYKLSEQESVRSTSLMLIGYISKADKDFLERKFVNQKKYNLDNEIIDLFKIDELDQKILDLLSKNCRVSNLEIASKLRTTGTTVKNRIEKLVKERVIAIFTITVDYTKLEGRTHLVLMNKVGEKMSKEALNKISGSLENIFIMIPWFDKHRFYYFRAKDEDAFIKVLSSLNKLKGGIVAEETPNIIIRKNLIW